MLLLDDILFAPAHGILWIFEEIHQAAQEAMVSESESITEQLRNLYMALETHNITAEQFDAGEKVLLDRLDSLEARGELQVEESIEEVVEASENQDEVLHAAFSG
jgi:hypothetical protein